MRKWLSNLFLPRAEPAPPDLPKSAAAQAETPPVSIDLFEQQNETQSLRIKLQAREEEIENLRQEIERLKYRQEQHLTERLNSRLAAIFEDLSGPASQILTLSHLCVEQQKPVQASDVLTVAHRMLRSLEQNGLVFESKVDDQVMYDPNRHIPIGEGQTPQTGQLVTVRFAGTSFEGKVIKKAGIE